jgi:hypothetical protein
MNDKNRFIKTFTLIIPTALFFFQELLSMPKVTSFLKITGFLTQIIIAVVLLLFFFLNQLCNVYRPFRRFKKIDKNKWGFLDDKANDLLNIYKRYGVDLRINLMIPRHKILNKKDEKTFLFKKRFFTQWNSHNMDYETDCHLSLMTDQGVCGEAYKTKGRVAADLTVQDPSGFNLCHEQINKTKELKFITSTPIFEQNEENLRKTDKIIGVVNFDSKSPGSEKLIKDVRRAKTFINKTNAFADLCSKIM